MQIITGGKSQKASIEAFARAWQNQLVVAKPMGYHQVIRSEDLKEQRVLVEQMPPGAAEAEQPWRKWWGRRRPASSTREPSSAREWSILLRS